MRRSSALPSWRATLRVLSALSLLHVLFSFEGAWPGPGLQLAFRPSLELSALMIGIAAAAAWAVQGGRPAVPGRPLPGAAGFWTDGYAHRLLGAGACAIVALVVLRMAEQLAPGLLGRPLNLAWDGRHGWNVATLAAGAAPRWLVVAACVCAVAGVWLIHRCSRWAMASLARACSHSRRARLALMAAGASPFALAATLAAAGTDSYGLFAAPVLPGLARQSVMLQAAWSPATAAARLPASPAFVGTVGRLRGADVLVVFVESYGVTTLDDPVQSAALASRREALAGLLRDGDRHVVSARVRSPTFGGGSWLAHAALLAGIDTTDPLRYDLLLTTRRSTLVSHFAANGYRTVAWMPGLQRPWPEGRFFGFDRLADADGIGYRGPVFVFWRIPDQASMALLHAQEVAVRPRPPLFAVMPTLDSHAPFVPLAPLQTDWQRLSRPDAYDVTDPVAASTDPAQTPWRAPVQAYLRSIGHTFAWLGAYLRDLAPPDMLVVVIGDHQPLALVSGQGASWDVPVHVIGRDRGLLARFEAAGFSPGLEPSAPALGPMHGLASLLVSALDGDPSGSDEAARNRQARDQRAWMSPEGASGASAASQSRMPAASRPPG